MRGRSHGVRLVAFGDQVAFSVGNFLLTVMLGRDFAQNELAAYGIGLSNALILQGMLRGCYVVQNSLLPAAVFARRRHAVMAEQLIVVAGTILAELSLLAAWRMASPGSFDPEVAVATLSCSLLYVQLEFERVVQLKQGRVASPFLASLLYLLMNGALFLTSGRTGIGFGSVMAWQAGYAVLKIMWLVRTTGWPDFRLGWRLARRDFRRYLPSSIVGAAGYSGFTHLPLLILNHFAPAAQVAGFVAMRGLAQPLQIVVRTMDLVDKNLFHHRSGGTPEGRRKLVLGQLLIYGSFGVATVLAILLLGDWLIAAVYHGRYAGMNGVYLGWGAVFGLMALNAPLQTLLISRGKVNLLNRHRTYAGIAGIATALVLCGPLAASGAIVATIVGWLVCSAFAAWTVREAIFRVRVVERK